mmetsp:Transcript_61581/g.174903  ORF Transcript_61581/g.174903 Transcript_61581/m.174903 type:complete len:448 (+) Transcript_61581:195-1538(+)
MPHLGSATVRKRSSVMPLTTPSSSTPARWKMPAMPATSRRPTTTASALSGRATSTTRHSASRPPSGREPARLRSTSCSGRSCCSPRSQPTTAEPRPPVAPVSRYTAGLPSGPLLGTQGSLLLGAGIGSSRGAKRGPWRDALCTQMSTSCGCWAASAQNPTASSLALARQQAGTKIRFMLSSLASIATALLAPATMAPATATGHTTTSCPVQPASSRRWTRRVNCQHCFTSTSTDWPLRNPSLGEQATTTTAPPRMAAAASSRMLGASSPLRSTKVLATGCPVGWAGRGAHRTAYNGRLPSMVGAAAWWIGAEARAGAGPVGPSNWPESAASSTARRCTRRPTASRRQAWSSRGRCSCINSWPPGKKCMPTGAWKKRCQPGASAQGATVSLVPQYSSSGTPAGSTKPAWAAALRRLSARASTPRSARSSGTTCSANSGDRATAGGANA